MASEIAELGGTLKRSRSESHYTTPGRVFVSRSLVYIIRVPNDIYNDDLKHQFEEILKKYNRSGKLKKVGSYSNGDIKLKEA